MQSDHPPTWSVGVAGPPSGAAQGQGWVPPASAAAQPALPHGGAPQQQPATSFSAFSNRLPSRMRPELFVNWATDSCHLDYLKVKKTLKVLLVQLTGTVAYNLHTREVTTKFSCKDTVFNGRITFEPSDQAVMYRKRFTLPALSNKLGCFVASGRWAYSEVTQTWNPSFKVGFEFRHGSAELVRPNTVRFKPRLFLGPLGLQAKTLLSVQLPSKMLFDLAPLSGEAGGAGGVRVGDDGEAMGINLEVQQLDLVVRL